MKLSKAVKLFAATVAIAVGALVAMDFWPFRANSSKGTW